MAKSKIVLLEYTNPFDGSKSLTYIQRSKAASASKTYTDYSQQTYIQTKWGRSPRYAKQMVRPKIIEPIASRFELQLNNINSHRRNTCVQWKILSCAEQPELEGYNVYTSSAVLMKSIQENKLRGGDLIGTFTWHGKYNMLMLVPDDS